MPHKCEIKEFELVYSDEFGRVFTVCECGIKIYPKEIEIIIS